MTTVNLGRVQGESAYQTYVRTTTDNPIKTEVQWITSLKGEKGDPGSGGGGVPSGIAKISFTGDTVGMTKDTSKNLQFRYESADKTVEGFVKVNWQGTSSIGYPKKNYTLKFYTDSTYTTSANVDFNNWGGQNKFVMKANYIDFTQARNVVNARIWKEMVLSRKSIPEELLNSPGLGAIEGFPCELYINNEYFGIYTFNVPKAEWMAGMDSANPLHAGIVGEANGTGNSTTFGSNTNLLASSNWSWEFPSSPPESIITSFTDMHNFVRTSTHDEFKQNLETYLDKEACIDYYIFMFATCGLDGLAKNMMMLTFDGVKWYPSAYDLDSTWGLWWDGTKLVGTKLHPIDYQADSRLWRKIDRNFRAALAERYKYLRQTVLSTPNIIAKFENFMSSFNSGNYEKDRARWSNIPSRNLTDIKQLRSYISQRMQWVDNVFSSYEDYNAEKHTVESVDIDFSTQHDSYSLPSPWRDELGIFKVKEGVLAPSSLLVGGRNSGDALCTINFKQSDMEIELDATLIAANTARGLVIRGIDESNYIRLDVVSGNIRLLKKVDNRDTTITTTPYTATTRQTIKVRSVGSSLTVAINDVPVITQTITEHVGGTMYGFVINSASSGTTDLIYKYKATPITQ